MLSSADRGTKSAKSRTKPVSVERESEFHPFHPTNGHGVWGSVNAPLPSAPHPLATMHHAFGNQAVLRSLSARPPAIQTKLTINTPGDQYEQEADRVAEQVMRMPDPATASPAPVLQRKCACGGSGGDGGTCSECAKKEELQRSAAGPAAVLEAPLIVHDVLGQPGRPLDAGTRAFFEPRFGHDFDSVRMHNDSKAAKSASAVNAMAYTVGRDIIFGEGQYSPSSNEGQYLVAHELTHVLQQSSTSHRLQRQSPPPGSAPQRTTTDVGPTPVGQKEVANPYALTDLEGYWHLGYVDGFKNPTTSLMPPNLLGPMPHIPWSVDEQKAYAEGVKAGQAIASGAVSAQSALAAPAVAGPPACTPTSAHKAKDLSEYVAMLQCAEKRIGLGPREMLAIFRQLYYGKPWSNDPGPTFAGTSLWDLVISCSPPVGFSLASGPSAPQYEAGLIYLVRSLQYSQEIGGVDVGHVFVGLEAMTCPTSSVSNLDAMPNEDFATWGGDLGAAVAAQDACPKTSDKGLSSDDCGNTAGPQPLSFYLASSAPFQDLEGDIDPFVIRASQAGIPCTGSDGKALVISKSASSTFYETYIDPGSVLGKVHKNRYRCMLEVLGATISGNTVTNRAAMLSLLAPRVFSFADAYFRKIMLTSSSQWNLARGYAAIFSLGLSESQSWVGADKASMMRNSTEAVKWFLGWLESKL